jgi:acyl transferase domain-containing protein/pimeloyl-ACP methyl ester carboxylesterase
MNDTGLSDTGQRLARLPALKMALLTQELRAKTELLAAEPIAVVGMGCRFPGGGNNPEQYWRLLAKGVDAVAPVPKSRWNAEFYYDPDPEALNKMYNCDGGFLDVPVDQFDAEFFGITPREADHLDPQQRLLLEVSWEAIEDAGISPHSLSGSNTGVFVGISSVDYLKQSAECSTIDGYSGTGNAHSAAAGRLSYTLGLRGPCVAMDTACSSSLVALHLACMNLRNRECDGALVGGVNLMLSPLTTVLFSKLRILSPSGRCLSFDSAADGYVRGEGCGVIYLKRLSDAIANQDRVLAVVRGTAINQNGCSVGLTVPNGPAQQAVIRRALAYVSPDDVDYVEAHGTGTSLGDPIEVHALKAVFAPGRKKPLYIGSAKTNLGHLEAAAGIAGIAKVILALQKEEIPPHLHLRTLNPRIALDGAPIVIPTSPVPWPRSAQRRCAGVSSFGFVGTNAHAVLEEAPMIERRAPEFHRPAHLLTLSAGNTDSLERLRALYLAELEKCDSSALPDLCFTANTGRVQFSFRLTAAGADAAQIAEALRRTQPAAAAAAATPPSVVFLFSGLDIQHVHRVEQLYAAQPTVRETLKQCDAILGPLLPVPLLELVHRPDHAAMLERTECAHAALFAMQWALWRMWRDWGVRPAAVAGYDAGEFAAACAAGVMEWETGLRLIALSASLRQRPLWEEEARRVNYQRPQIEWVSSFTGAPVQDVIDGDFWRGLHQPVRFASGLQTLFRRGHSMWLEIGPASTLLEIALAQNFDPSAGMIHLLPTLEPGIDVWPRLLATLGQLWEAGVEIDWKAYDLPYGRAKVAAPTYPFHRQRYWVSSEEISEQNDTTGVLSRHRIKWANTGDTTPHAKKFRQSSASASFSGGLHAAGLGDREERLKQYLRGKLAAALGESESEITDGSALLELSIDSLTAINLFSDIRHELGLILYPRDFSDHPTLAEIASYMASLMSEKTEIPESTLQADPIPEEICAQQQPTDFEPPREQFIDLRWGRMCVCEWGEKGGSTVICVHGLLDQGGVWAPMATALARSGFHVLAPDLQGHGRSDHARGSLSNQLVELLADLDQLTSRFDNTPFTLVGHSMGAALAAIFAALWPERVNALVLLELPSALVELPSSHADADAADLLLRQVRTMVSPPCHPIFNNLRQAGDRLRQAFPFLSLELASMLAERATKPVDVGYCWTWDPLLKTQSGLVLSRKEYREILRRIAAPVALVYGAASDFVGREGRDMHGAALPSATRVTLPGGHHLPLEDPRAVSEVILAAATEDAVHRIGSGAG